MKEFICQFLGIPETDYADLQINSKLMEDLLEAYVSHLEKQRAEREYPDGEQTIGYTTNDTQEDYKKELHSKCCGRCDGVNDLCIVDIDEIILGKNAIQQKTASQETQEKKEENKTTIQIGGKPHTYHHETRSWRLGDFDNQFEIRDNG